MASLQQQVEDFVWQRDNLVREVASERERAEQPSAEQQPSDEESDEKEHTCGVCGQLDWDVPRVECCDGTCGRRVCWDCRAPTTEGGDFEDFHYCLQCRAEAEAEDEQ